MAFEHLKSYKPLPQKHTHKHANITLQKISGGFQVLLSGTPRSPPSGCGLHLTFNSCPVRVAFGPTEAAVCTTPWSLDALHPAEPGPAFPGHQRSYGSDLFRGSRDDSCLRVGRRPVGWWVVFGCPACRGSHGALGLTLPPLRLPRAVSVHLFCVGGQRSAVGTDGGAFAPGPRAVACGDTDKGRRSCSGPDS